MYNIHTFFANFNRTIVELSNDVFHDRGSTFMVQFFLEDGVSLTQNRRNANFVSKNCVFVYLTHGTIHRDAI